jgi:hypothetical protein
MVVDLLRLESNTWSPGSERIVCISVVDTDIILVAALLYQFGTVFRRRSVGLGLILYISSGGIKTLYVLVNELYQN